jgi:hypothetical protein
MENSVQRYRTDACNGLRPNSHGFDLVGDGDDSVAGCGVGRSREQAA